MKIKEQICFIRSGRVLYGRLTGRKIKGAYEVRLSDGTKYYLKRDEIAKGRGKRC